ncbi:ROK family protein [Streptomyces physcomitrii]|uniref:ROK family protein n=1 Tax=Streptomyces physcomitrii TaxID=2724184 RepID=UPI00342F5DB0
MSDPGRVLAVDVGGTWTKAAVVEGGPEDPAVRARRRVRTPRCADGTENAEAVVALVAELAARFAERDHGPVEAVGVVVPGIVQDGVGVHSVNLGWRDYPFREALAKAVGAPVAFGHDVAAAGLAEWRLGAARGLTDVVVMPIGTGIASALILGGRPLTGGYAGEIGHVDIGHGEQCPCGQRGCLDHVASAASVARRFGERSGRTVRGSAEVLRAARAGDRVAAEVWDEAVTSLTRGVLLLATLLGPQRVVLGGGLALAGEALTGPLNRRLTEQITFQRRPELRCAAFGAESGCIGAALLAWEAVAP